MGTQEIKISDADHPYAKENGVAWAEEAWERVKHAPEFVRPGIQLQSMVFVELRAYQN